MSKPCPTQNDSAGWPTSKRRPISKRTSYRKAAQSLRALRATLNNQNLPIPPSLHHLAATLTQNAAHHCPTVPHEQWDFFFNE